MEFLAHKAFCPVLMAKSDGYSKTHKTRLEHVQQATRAEIDRFRAYGSAEEVIVNSKRDLNWKSARKVQSEVKALNLPVISDVREELERRVSDPGFTAQWQIAAMPSPAMPRTLRFCFRQLKAERHP